MLRKAKDSASEVAAVAVAIPQPVSERPEVQQAAQDLAQARDRLVAAEQELASAAHGIEEAERQASGEWTGGDPPATLARAHLRRGSAESLCRVALAGVQAATGRFQVARARAQQRYRAELEQTERELITRLDGLLLEAGRLDAALAMTYVAARENLGSRFDSGTWPKTFPALVPDSWGRVPAGVLEWRRTLRKHGMLPEGDDQDWEALCRPLRPAPMVLPTFTPPVAPAGRADRAVPEADGGLFTMP